MFTADNKHFNFSTQLYQKSMAIKDDYMESDEVTLKRNVYDFLTDCNAIDKSGILNILKYVMVKKNL